MNSLAQLITNPNKEVIKNKIMIAPLLVLVLLNIVVSLIAYYLVDIEEILGSDLMIERNIGFLITSVVFTIISIAVQLLLVSLYFWITGLVSKANLDFKRIFNVISLATVIIAVGQLINILQLQVTNIPSITGLGGIFEQSSPIISSLLTPIEIFNILHLLFIYIALKQITNKKSMPIISVALYLLFQILLNLVPVFILSLL